MNSNTNSYTYSSHYIPSSLAYHHYVYSFVCSTIVCCLFYQHRTLYLELCAEPCCEYIQHSPLHRTSLECIRIMNSLKSFDRLINVHICIGLSDKMSDNGNERHSEKNVFRFCLRFQSRCQKLVDVAIEYSWSSYNTLKVKAKSV